MRFNGAGFWSRPGEAVGTHVTLLSASVSLQTLSSAVVQVFTADRNSSWNKRCCGVACLVKDNPQRSYFIRVFDIKASTTMTPSMRSPSARHS